ncbi:MAG: hypothetical protein OIF32_01035 [Campylobacterales bacterium]|nr:hypothetical protein [Campylobacterales bacterium]
MKIRLGIILAGAISANLYGGMFSYDDEPSKKTGKNQQKKKIKIVSTGKTKKDYAISQGSTKLTQNAIKNLVTTEPYIDENYKIYLKQNKFYIYVSSSKDGKKLPIPIDGGRDITSLKLSKSGKNDIRYYGSDKKKIGNMGIIWDNKPPSVKLYHKGVSMFNRNKDYYFPAGTLEVGIKDNLSGGNKIFYTINNNKIKELKNKGTLPIYNEGLYNLDFIAVDNVGNIGKKTSKRFFVDTTPPKSKIVESASSINCKKEHTIGRRTNLSIKAQDNIAGVKTTTFSIDGGKYKKYSKPLTFKDLKNLRSGEHNIKFYSVDKVKNQEKVNNYKFNFDLTAPETSHKFIENIYKYDGITYVSPSTKVVLKSEDCSGVDNTIVFLEDDRKRNYIAPISFKELASRLNKNINQKTTLYYHSIDKLGNKELINKKDIVLDFEPPKLKIDFIGRFVKEDGVHYVHKDVKLKVKGNDLLSGIKSMKYSIDDRDYSSYEGPLMLRDITDYEKFRFYFKAKDNVENASEANPIDIVVDRRAPELTHHFSYNGLKVEGVEVSDGKNGLNNYPLGTQLYVNTIDDIVGVNKVYVRLNDVEKEYVGKPIQLNKEGIYRISIRVSDRVGNEVSSKFKIRVLDFKNGVIKTKKIF